MGKVVDSPLRVMGISGLRIADASVLTLPIASHYQACIFALAEQAVDLILSELYP
jgi:choline dehydrogenase-like flavoprotein